MKTLPVIDAKDVERREKFERIDLKNRPRLGIDLTHLDQVAGALASNDRERQRFIENPVGYLKGHRIEVPSARFVKAQPAQTAELCTGPVAACNAAIVVNVGLFFNAIAQVNVGVQAFAGVQAVTRCFNRTSGCGPFNQVSNDMDTALPVWL